MNRFTGDWCHAGGQNGEHENYGWPHVAGCVRFGDTEVIAKNCFCCGKDLPAEFVGGIHE